MIGKIKNLLFSVIDSFYILNVLKSQRFCLSKQIKGSIAIMLSGPSLEKDLLKFKDLATSDMRVMMVNDMAQLDIYKKYKPNYYCFADCAYWLESDKTNAVDVAIREKTFEAIITLTTWHLTILVPREALKYKTFITKLSSNKNITIVPMNLFNLIGKSIKLQNFLYRHNFAAPGSNVLCQAIYSAINLGYKTILILGSDHSWLTDLRVNEKNQVCTIKRHYGNEDSELIPWLRADKRIFTMPEILSACYNTFNDYHRLKKYADSLNVNIINLTTYSFIDAFDKH